MERDGRAPENPPLPPLGEREGGAEWRGVAQNGAGAVAKIGPATNWLSNSPALWHSGSPALPLSRSPAFPLSRSPAFPLSGAPAQILKT